MKVVYDLTAVASFIPIGGYLCRFKTSGAFAAAPSVRFRDAALDDRRVFQDPCSDDLQDRFYTPKSHTP